MGLWFLSLLLLPVHLLPHHQPLCVHLAGDHHGALQGHHEAPGTQEQPDDLPELLGDHLGGECLHLPPSSHLLQAHQDTVSI